MNPFRLIKSVEAMKAAVQDLRAMYASQVRQEILRSPRYADDKRLIKFGFKVYSQADEDGIIRDIFKRIGIINRTVVEIGCSNGLETNTLYLLIQGWRGLWIEGDPNNVISIKRKFAHIIEQDRLQVQCAHVDQDNANLLVERLSPSSEIDLLSIDIDGNDYHVFKAIESISPRVVVIEYNAKFPPPTEWIMEYNPKHSWDGKTDYFGASIKSLELLSVKKGYALVGCNLSGVNAFFVRLDLLGNNFREPYTAENHYEPARYWLNHGFVSGHAPNFAPSQD